MVRKRVLEPPSVFNRTRLLDFMQKNDIKPLHADKIWRHLTSSDSLQGINQLPKAAEHGIPAEFELLTTRIVQQQTSRDKQTTKLLVRLQDGKEVESVIMRFPDKRKHKNERRPLTHADAADEKQRAQNELYDNDDVECDSFLADTMNQQNEDEEHALSVSSEGSLGRHRVTLCISSQVGCQMGCTFCATGTMGLQVFMICYLSLSLSFPLSLSLLFSCPVFTTNT